MNNRLATLAAVQQLKFLMGTTNLKIGHYWLLLLLQAMFLIYLKNQNQKVGCSSGIYRKQIPAKYQTY